MKVAKKDRIFTGGTHDQGNRLGIGIYRQLAIKRRNVQQGKFNNERSIHAT
jgi:hypothetical protein